MVMKTIKLITGFALSGLVLLSACHKDNNAVVPMTVSDKTKNAMVIFDLVTNAQTPGSLIQWNGGYISTGSITFKGVHEWGNSLRLDQYTAAALQQVPLFCPGRIGTVSVPIDHYDHVSFSTTIQPINNLHSFFLSGTFFKDGWDVPVEIMIDQQVDITSIWINNITITPKTSQSILTIDPAQLITGFDATALNAATIDDRKIIISAISNQNLFDIVLNNLKTAKNVQFKLLPPVVEYQPPLVTPPTESY